ncbi:MAG: ABC transporter ATP-binding protein [SAR324 cluster bacterium]|jgi:putative spermidine/putrescine transport system ATP-binding protein|nr:ABC transporter ATP-binding protein [SAR324 cluster bacterium]MDP7440061.1 ABC transporter ATP-binding protein [SAR324 cluster bacterium]|tara:strand:+ start:482 stop:1561 length:1080 start_codon:yes stop_codon:yes gene_type:complete
MKSNPLNISIKDITKKYGDFYALKEINLEVMSGEFLTLLGPSGSGKTTLLMALAGFTSPDYGSIKFGNEEVVLKPPHLRGIGMVFQNYALFPHMNVEQNVGYPQKLRGVSKSSIKETVEEALSTVKLDGLGHRGVSELSGGQKQRVALARAIVFKPKILLMDEPLSALDKKLREEMQIELRHLHDSLNITTVYVTHDQKEALTMSDRIAVINEGSLMQLGTPTEIYNNPNNSFIADFIGESSLIPIKVKDKCAQLGAVKLLVNHKVDFDGDYLLVIRPEKLFLSTGNEINTNFFVVSVLESIFQGESQLLVIKLDSELFGEQSLQMRIANGTDLKEKLPAVGEKISVGLRMADTFLVEK